MSYEPDLVDQFVDWFTTVRRAQTSSIQQYATCLRAYVEQVNPLTATPSEVEAFVGRNRRTGPPAPATQARDRVIVNTFHSWLVLRLHRADNPVPLTGVPKVRNRQPKAIDDAVLTHLWGSPMPDEERVWFGLAAFAGLRRSEVIAISPSNFNLSLTLVEHLERKGGGTFPIEYGALVRVIGDRLPHLLPNPEGFLNLVEWLVRAREGERWLVPWVTETTPANAVNKRLMRLLRAAGMSATAFSPHALRHTCATNMLRCGIPLEIAADQLSHSSIETTRRYLSTSGQLSRWAREER